MNVIICIDDDGGIAFNNRRQSQDKELIKKICEMTEGKKLWVSHYSEPLFLEYKDYINTSDNLLSEAAEDEYCFVECTKLSQYDLRIRKLILVRWNRRYPSDIQFDLDMSNYKLENSEDITGSSHGKITLEVYSHKA